MASKSIRDRLLTSIDDLELTCKVLFETLLTPKPQRVQSGQNTDIGVLAELIVSKHNELKSMQEDAIEQEEFEKKIEQIKIEVDKEEEEIKSLQKKLKEAEHILATAIFQAKQKLQLIKKANSNPIPSDELIKFAHKISSSHAVAAPYNWEQGDPRRPYPTDMEMKLGLIGQSTDFPSANHLQSAATSSQQINNTGQLTGNGQFERPSTTSSTFNWSATGSGDIKPSLMLNSGSGGTQTISKNTFSNLMEVKTNGANKDSLEDVEVMSTDSSSSSSSDSQ